MLRLPDQIVTTRLILRLPVAEDASPFFRAFAADAEVTRYLDWTACAREEDLHLFLDTLALRRARGEEVAYAIAPRAAADAPCGLLAVRDQGCRAELGFVLGRAAWGRGLMTEALAAVVPAVFATTPEVARVQALADAENARSHRVLERAGLRREGLLRRYAIHACSPLPRDVWMYAVTRDDLAAAGTVGGATA